MVGCPLILPEVQFHGLWIYCMLVKGHSWSVSEKVTDVYEVIVALTQGSDFPVIFTVSDDAGSWKSSQSLPQLSIFTHLLLAWLSFTAGHVIFFFFFLPWLKCISSCWFSEHQTNRLLVPSMVPHANVSPLWDVLPVHPREGRNPGALT